MDVSSLSFPAKLVISLFSSFITLVMPLGGMIWSMKTDIAVSRALQEADRQQIHQQMDDLKGSVKEYRDSTAQTLADHTRQLTYINATIQQLEVTVAEGKGQKK